MPIQININSYNCGAFIKKILTPKLKKLPSRQSQERCTQGTNWMSQLQTLVRYTFHWGHFYKQHSLACKAVDDSLFRGQLEEKGKDASTPWRTKHVSTKTNGSQKKLFSHDRLNHRTGLPNSLHSGTTVIPWIIAVTVRAVCERMRDKRND